MTRALQIATLALVISGAMAFLSVCAFFGLSTWTEWQNRGIIKHFDGVLTRFEVVEGKLFGTAKNLDAASRIWADSAKSQARTVAQLAENANDAILVAKGAMVSARTTLDTINEQAAHIGPLLDSARAATDAVPQTLDGLYNTSRAATQSMTDLDDLLKSQAVRGSIANFADLLGNANGIAVDGRKVADKATLDYLTPKPWWMKVGQYAGDAADFGALFARHVH